MKNKVITISFLAVILIIFTLNLFLPDKVISLSERRDLDQLPQFTIEKLLNSKFMEEFDEYALDQFLFRDDLRKMKGYIEFNIFNKKDNNDIYVIDDSVFKMEYPLDMKNLENMSEYINNIQNLYLKDCNVFFSMIPDKNYFVADENNYLSMDYDFLESTLLNNIENIKYIDIKNSLDISDYYRTDIHWSQDKLGEVVKKISEEMNFVTDVNSIQYEKKSYYPFYGVYYGQTALNIDPDTIYYLDNPNMENIIIDNVDYKGEADDAPGVYDVLKLESMDSYNLFLSGATPLITIENPNCTTGKELIIFRDSFASSLAPLLIEEYSKITLIDFRYVHHEIIDDYVDFNDQDVLFLYSTIIINNSNILK